ncbi:chromosome transmission fidelity protein 8 [[Candida] railenensis]|uniref:Chromosome transmission fidelity protein 8 n=1 Tax=[Candida] railenensis TaxID=45579 RepID=A0A9P0VXK2_9ASCO|nr:chromosome transmission fidelity protein 8 [[Candida] railenensis]
MPKVNIDCSEIKKNQSNSSNVISTPFGLAIIEIQGELNIPEIASSEENPDNLKVDDLYTAVKFGKLIVDPVDDSKVTLFVGTSQRMLGKIVKIDPPLGVLKINANDKNEMKMIDVIKKKIIFKDRPLPIM